MLYAVAPPRASPSDKRFFASGCANSEINRKSVFLMTTEVGIGTKITLVGIYVKWATPTFARFDTLTPHSLQPRTSIGSCFTSPPSLARAPATAGGHPYRIVAGNC